jgi:hypothetical protein
MTRFRAVDAREFAAPAHEHPDVSLLTAHNLLKRTRRSHYEIDRAGAVGCSLSHFGVWRGLLNSGAPAVLMFEDDVELPVDMRARLEKLFAVLPAEWDVIQFTATRFETGLGCAPDPAVGPDWWSCTSLMGAHAYMVSRRGAERLLARAYPIELHVDAYMAFMARLGLIKMLWNPLIDIGQSDMGSDIAHGGSGILNVPTNMEGAGVYAMEGLEVLALVALAAVAGGMLSLAFAGRR